MRLQDLNRAAAFPVMITVVAISFGHPACRRDRWTTMGSWSF